MPDVQMPTTRTILTLLALPAALLLVVFSGIASAGRPAEAFLPGITARQALAQFKGYGFSCVGPIPAAGGLFWSCVSSDDAADGLQIRARDASHLTAIDASAFVYLDRDDDTLRFLERVAALPYRGARPAIASGWITANRRRGGTLVIGGVRLVLTTQANARYLLLTPVT